MLLALLALGLLNGASLLEGIFDVEEMVDVKRLDEVRGPGFRETGHPAARGTGDVVGLAVGLHYQLQTLLTEHVKARQDPRVRVAVEADRAC